MAEENSYLRWVSARGTEFRALVQRLLYTGLASGTVTSYLIFLTLRLCPLSTFHSITRITVP